MRFAYVTGWRVQSEILPLEWRQVDRDAKTVTLDPGATKNKKGRVLDYGDHVALCERRVRRVRSNDNAQAVTEQAFDTELEFSPEQLRMLRSVAQRWSGRRG